MPAVSGDYDPDVGILLQVGILTGGTVQATRRDEDSGDSLTVAGTQTLGLVDTGASKTSISPRLAGSLAERQGADPGRDGNDAGQQLCG